MADDTPTTLAGEIASRLSEVLDQHREKAESTTFTEVRKDVQQNTKDIAALQIVVYKEHEPVILWCRNFMDSYRKIVSAVIVSGLITLAGFLVQVYYLLQKSGTK